MLHVFYTNLIKLVIQTPKMTLILRQREYNSSVKKFTKNIIL